jgi:hypothetical protein
VDLLESVESSHTSSTSFLSHLFGEKKEIFDFFLFLFTVGGHTRANLGE